MAAASPQIVMGRSAPILFAFPIGEGFVSRIALFSYRSLPHWGRGTAPAVDRVLSLIVDLRCISPLIFHTARTLSGSLRSPPSPRGEGFVRRYCFPHMRVFALTMREKRYSRFVAFPIGEGGPRQRWIGYSRISST